MTSSSRTGLEIASRPFVRMLGPEVADVLRKYHTLERLQEVGCIIRYTDQGLRSRVPPIVPYAPFERSRVYTASREAGSWNIDSQLAKLDGRYYYGFTNGRMDEDTEGQQVRISSSDDARTWSTPRSVIGGEEGTRDAFKCVGLIALNGSLYMLIRWARRVRDPNSNAVGGGYYADWHNARTYVYASSEGTTWTRAAELSERISATYEAPRLTADGQLLGVASIDRRSGPAILLWPGDDITEQPEILPLPQPFGSKLDGGESSWYQTDDGTIVIFWRDDSQSCRVWVNYSSDGGRTFSDPAISDIPDAMSRNYAGRLPDGRYYLCNNANATLHNRMNLTLLIGEDGYTFQQIHILVDDPTDQRLRGLLKLRGYMYPCCLVDEDRLLVGYSVNKEDIECGAVDLRALAS